MVRLVDAADAIVVRKKRKGRVEEGHRGRTAIIRRPMKHGMRPSECWGRKGAVRRTRGHGKELLAVGDVDGPL